MGRIAGDQDPAAPVGVGQSAVHGEHRQPLRITDTNVEPGALGQHRSDPLENLTVSGLLTLVRVIGEDPPQIAAALGVGHRHHADHAIGMYPPGRTSPVDVPIQMHIRQQEAFGELYPGKPDIRQLPCAAGGTVAPDDPTGPDRLAAVEFGQRAPGFLPQTDQGPAPLRHETESSQPVSQRTFDPGLRHHHRWSGSAQTRVTELQRHQRTSAQIAGDPHGAQRLFGKGPEAADAAQHLRTAGVQEVRPRCRGRAAGAIDDPHRQSVQAQRTRQRQTGGPGAHHQHVDVHRGRSHPIILTGPYRK